MEFCEILKLVHAVPVNEQAIITQLKHIEDNEPYQVWLIDTDCARYILKEVHENEFETYRLILSELNESSIPAIYQNVLFDGKCYFLMEYIDGEDLCKCNRTKLTLTLDALISLQRKTWNNLSFASYGYSFEKSLHNREHRAKFLNDTLLDEAYQKFMHAYRTLPRALCHDDLLPFNVITSPHRAVFIDWEFGGILPYPVSFARLIAHGEAIKDARFFMSPEDRIFAINYYYDHLLKENGISYTEWKNTLEYFLFSEYCEWVFIGNKYDTQDSELCKKYLPLARQQG